MTMWLAILWLGCSSDGPPHSEPSPLGDDTPDTDDLQEPETPTLESDLSGADSDTQVESDPLADTLDTTPVEESEHSDIPTDTGTPYVYGVRPPTAWPDMWPIPPRCSFSPGMVVAPPPTFRAIDFQSPEADGFFAQFAMPSSDNTRTWVVAGMGAFQQVEFAAAYELPESGVVTHLQAEVFRTEMTGTDMGTYHNGLVDLDSDGNGDFLALNIAYDTVTREFQGRLFGYDVGVESPLPPVWTLDPSEGATWIHSVISSHFDNNPGTDLIVGMGQGLTGVRIDGYSGPFGRGAIGVPNRTWRLDYSANGLGALLPGTGDLNGDNIPDLVMAWLDPIQPHNGHVRVFFGPLAGDIQPVATDVRLEGTRSSQYSSFSDFIIQDIDGDGFEDLIVSGHEDTWDGLSYVGAVYIFKGPFQTGDRWRDIDADTIIRWPTVGARTGLRLTKLGDVDGDLRPEFAIMALGSRALPPPGVDVNVDWPVPTIENGPFLAPEGAIMVFGNTPPGVIGPEHAKFIIMGEEPGDLVGWSGVVGPGDVSGDGLADIAYANAAYGNGLYLTVLHPCEDFGTPPP